MKEERKQKLAFAVVGGIVLLAGLGLSSAYEKYLLQEKRGLVLQAAERTARVIHQQMSRNLANAYSLAALVRQGRGEISDFDEIARETIALNPGIAALQLAPGGVVRRTVPLAGNEKAIGHKLLTDEKRNKEALLALQTRQLTVAGPFELIQGGKAFIGRLPVFLGPAQHDFWGFTIVVTRLDPFLDSVRLQDLERQGYSYELWRIHPDTGQRDVFARSATGLISQPTDLSIDVPNGAWHLSLSPQREWGNSNRELAELLLALLAGTAAGWIAYARRRSRFERDNYRRNLESSVAERTRQLGQAVDFNRAIVVNSPLPMGVYAEDGRCAAANEAYARLLGTGQQALLEENFHHIGWWKTSGLLDDALAVLREGKPLRREACLPTGTDGETWLDCRLLPVTVNGAAHLLAQFVDLTERKRADAESRRSLRFLQGLDRINRAIAKSDDLEAVLNAVLDDVLDIFDCDRAFLLFPCDPDAATWSVPLERTRPAYPGVLERGLIMPMTPDVSRTLNTLLAASGPVKFGPGSPYPLPAGVAEQFEIRSILSAAIRPKMGKPWQFGLHQCSRERQWSEEDERLFEEVGRRLGDGLTGLLAHRELREQERQFRTLVENIPDLVVRYDTQLNRLYVNPAWERAAGLSSAEVVNVPMEAIPKVPQPTIAEYVAALRQALATGERQELEFDWVNADGRTLYLHYSVVPEFDAAGKVASLLAVGYDLTARRQAEELQHRLNRELRAISNCNQALIRARDEESLLNEICRIVCEEAGYRMAWVGYLDPEAATLRPVALAGEESGYVAEALAIQAATGNREAPPIVAVQSGEMTGVTDFLTDASVAPWREAALRRGYRSTISLPLKNSRGVFACLTIYSAEPGAFTPPEERRLLGELADDLAYGITALRTDIKRAEAEKKIEYLAFYDLLTGLPNRRLFMDRLQQAMTGSARTGHIGALLFIDLDNFKIVNDTSGHDVGDQLLIQVGARLCTCLRDGDTVSRLGGDEFVAMLEDLGESPADAAAHARTVADKITETLADPYVIAGRMHLCTPSIGATLFPGGSDSVDDVLKQADIAMYQAKAAGRNTLRFFDPEMQAAVAARAALETDLRRAIGERQFVLHFQPQVDSTRRILGAEALIRWQHPERGMIPPNHFIPIAEETGLILQVGQWVLDEACAHLAEWRHEPATRRLQLAVNVSARQFRQADFVDTVRAALDRSHAPADRLKIELTESMVLDDVEDTIAKMSALERFGVGFSMDDFGTGYSSLSYLTRLPLDQLKIDQSFVRHLPDSRTDAVVAQSIISLARNLGLTVIAEGVETEAQRAFLEEHGCVIYQGYLFGRPVPLADFIGSMQPVVS